MKQREDLPFAAVEFLAGELVCRGRSRINRRLNPAGLVQSGHLPGAFSPDSLGLATSPFQD